MSALVAEVRSLRETVERQRDTLAALWTQLGIRDSETGTRKPMTS